MEKKRVCGATGRTGGFENDEKCDVGRAEHERDDTGFQAASVNQSVDEIRERCKTKTRKEVCVTRIEEVDDDEHEKSERETREAGGRCRGRKRKRKSLEKGRQRENTILDIQANNVRIEREMTHLPFRSWCRHCIKGRVREEDCRNAIEEERDSPRKTVGQHVHGRREGRENVFGGQGKKDESCAQHGGSEEKSTGDWRCRRQMARLREIGLEFLDIIVKSDNEPALTSLIESWNTLRAMGREQSLLEVRRATGLL